MTSKRPRLLVFNDPHPMRISKELAMEIGYNESVVLLQLEYLISISTAEEHDGLLWTYQSLEDLQANYFPWWSVPTISRIVKSLEGKHLIRVGNFNKRGYDRTQWFALDPEGLNKLESVKLDDAIFQNEKWKRANCKMEARKMKNAFFNLKNPSAQNVMTIPETPTETPAETSTQTSAAEAEALIAETLASEAATAAGLPVEDFSSVQEPENEQPLGNPICLSDNLTAFRESGLGLSSEVREAASLPHVTPGYIRGQAGRLHREGRFSPGLLLHVVRSGDSLPKVEPARSSDPGRYAEWEDP